MAGAMRAKQVVVSWCFGELDSVRLVVGNRKVVGEAPTFGCHVEIGLPKIVAMHALIHKLPVEQQLMAAWRSEAFEHYWNVTEAPLSVNAAALLAAPILTAG